ncbi:hypothetical protein Bbelb_279840 [Branchiostoma belcheri]|nr:hypothetical protein Bbelb_279840 [Branchiostoma belcheri]
MTSEISRPYSYDVINTRTRRAKDIGRFAARVARPRGCRTLRHLDTSAPGHFGTWTLRHLYTLAPVHFGTWTVRHQAQDGSALRRQNAAVPNRPGGWVPNHPGKGTEPFWARCRTVLDGAEVSRCRSVQVPKCPDTGLDALWRGLDFKK